MKNSKSSLRRILNAFIITTVITTSITLVASGIAISKVNTEYMSTGVRASKIVAERENEEIFISVNGQRLGQKSKPDIDKILSLAPAPINSIYFIVNAIQDLLSR